MLWYIWGNNKNDGRPPSRALHRVWIAISIYDDEDDEDDDDE